VFPEDLEEAAEMLAERQKKKRHWKKIKISRNDSRSY